MSCKIEFSRLLDLDEIGLNGLQQNIEANSEECGLLARRFGILTVYALSASLSIRKSNNDEMFTVHGCFLARVQQECNVSLDPFDEKISAKIDQTFVRVQDCLTEVQLEPDLEEAYDEKIRGKFIDLGEMVAQCFAIELSPYPRKPGVEYIQEVEKNTYSEVLNPFSKLAQLKPDGK